VKYSKPSSVISTVFESHAAGALVVETRLERDDVSGHERLAATPQPGALVHLETDSVAQSVEEALVVLRWIARVQLTRVALRLEVVRHLLVEVVGAGATPFQRDLERLPGRSDPIRARGP
jgi:hypothetical protein